MHRREVVHTIHCLDLKFPVVRLLHRAVFPHHHRGHCLRALNVRDIEALNSPRQSGQHQHILQCLADCLLRRLHHTEALVIALLRILPRQIYKRPLLSAHRNRNLHAMPAAFCQQRRQHRAIRKVHWQIHHPRHVLLIDIELLK